MTARDLCPDSSGAGCERCIERYEDDHTDTVDVEPDFYDVCGCNYTAVDARGHRHCVGCATREREDAAERRELLPLTMERTAAMLGMRRAS